MPQTLELRAIDSATYSSVGNASFTVNGSPVSSVDGTALVPVDSQARSYVVVATAPGYKTRTEILPAGSNSLTLSFPLEPADSNTGPVTIRTNPAVPNATITLSGPQTVVGVTDSDGEIEFDGLDAGDYQVGVDAPGYQARRPGESVSITPGRAADIAVVKTDPEPGTALIAPVSNASGRTPALPASRLEVTPFGFEDLPAPVSVAPGYYTATQCRLYINDIFIDELVSFQFVNSVNYQPLFGYGSRFAAAFAKGRALVQGQITLNYIHDRYLYAVLRQAREQVESSVKFEENKSDKPQQVDSDQLFQLLKQEEQLRTLPATPENQTALQLTQASLAPLLQQVSSDVVDDVVERRRAGQSPGSFRNVCYLPNTFRMKLVVGFDEAPTTREFEACKLISNEMIVDQKSGESLFESYGFIARRVK